VKLRASANGKHPPHVGWEWRPIGDFLVESRIPGSTGATARKLSVKLYGKGVEANAGRRVGSVNTRYFVRRAGQFIYSKLDFLNGAFGIVPKALDGYESTLDVPAFDFRPGIEPVWLLNYVARPEFYKAQAQKARGGRKARRIAPEDFLLMRIPSLPERSQTHLCEALSRLDSAVAANESAEARVLLAQTALLDRLMAKGRARWRRGTLESLCKETITYGIVQAGPHVADGVPYIRTGDMSGDELSTANLLRTSRKIAGAYERSRVRAGEIVCAIRATVGKVLLVPRALDGANLTQGTARIAPKRHINARFLLWALRTRPARKQFALASKGTTFSEITLADLRKIEVSFPFDLKEQVKIADALDASERYRRMLALETESLRSLRRGILTNIASGKLRLR
jgi:hypothetical protein